MSEIINDCCNYLIIKILRKLRTRFVLPTIQLMRSYVSIILVLSCLILVPNKLFSSNIGFEISWKAMNTNNLYQITLVYYRDCSGLPLCASGNCSNSSCVSSVAIYSGSSSDQMIHSVGSLELSFVSVRNSNVAQLCWNGIPNCTNMGCITPGSYTNGFERYEFTGLFQMHNPMRPNDCFFNIVKIHAGINSNTINGSSAGISAMINKCIASPSLSSGVSFHEDPVSVHPSGWGYIQNTGMYDQDKDSVSFTFTSLLSSLNNVVPYIVPYTATTPMPWQGNPNAQFPNGIQCVPRNGDMMFTPVVVTDFSGIVTVQAIKRRFNSQTQIFDTVGTTTRFFPVKLLRDITFNNIPVFQLNPIQGYNLFSNGLYIETMATDTLLFNIQSLDANQDSTYFSTLYPLNKIGARIEKTYDSIYRKLNGPLFDSVNFIWRPDTSKISKYPYQISLKAVDKICPIPGSTIRNLSILVRPKYNLNLSTAVNCGKISAFYNKEYNFVHALWQVFDIQSQQIGTSTSDTLNLQVYNKGKYVVKLTVNYGLIVLVKYDTVDVTHLSAINSILNFTTGVLSCENENRFIRIRTIDSLLTYRWIKNGTMMSNQQNDSLYFWGIGYQDTGIYRTMVISLCDTILSNISMVQIKSKPKIELLKSNYLICENNKMEIEVKTSGYQPLQHVWYKNGYLSLIDTTRFIRREITTVADSGYYRLIAINECGQFSDSLKVHIKSPTQIFQQPLSNDICPGSVAKINIVANDDSVLTFQWRKNGVIINNSNADSLIIPIMSSNHDGLYQVAVKGSCDTLFSNTAYLKMLLPLSILQQPQPVTECSGKAAVVKTIANGDINKYTWYKNFNTLDTLNQSALFFPNFNMVDTGLYFVTIENKCETKSSDTVKLAMKPITKISFSINDSIQCISNNLFVFNNTSTIETGSINTQWKFHDSSSSTGLIAQRIFNSPGKFPVKLVTNSTWGCSDSLIKDITVGTIIQPFNITGPSNVNKNDTVQYIAPVNQEYTYKWSGTNATIVSGENLANSQLKFIQSGQQQVQILTTKNTGCTYQATKNVNVINTNTSLQSHLNQIAIIKIYPNPAKNSFGIELIANHKTNANISLFNIIGSKVFETNVEINNGRNNIPISTNQSNGVYLLQINTGGYWITQKIMIQN